jgi:hypothetical protein
MSIFLNASPVPLTHDTEYASQVPDPLGARNGIYNLERKEDEDILRHDGVLNTVSTSPLPIARACIASTNAS